MIKYTLACDSGHTFESWFADSAAYDKQVKRGLVSCIMCGSAKIGKTIMAPRLAGTKHGRKRKAETIPDEAAPVAMLSPQEQDIRNRLREFRDHLTKNADNVGGKFPEEARKMHYGEIEHRSIYGEASPQEVKEMYEEGIAFHPLPVLPDEQN